jgi:O-antigen ligase
MQEFLKKAASNMAFAGAILICAGFIFSDTTPAPQSIGVALIFLHPFFNGGLKTAISNLACNRYAIGLGVYYLLIVISGLYTSNFKIYNQLIVMQLPLLLLPFGLYGGQVIDERKKDIIFIVLVVSVILAGLASFVHYLIHFEEIQEQITHSKPIPIVTGTNHIYYSILLAFSAAIVLWGLFVRKMKGRGNRNLAITAFFVIVFLLHTISARTGLFCFYTEMSVSVIWLVIVKKRIFQGVQVAVGLVILAFIALWFVPSVKNRVQNTRLDLHKYSSGEDINHYSLSMRFAALKTAYHVFTKNPVIGVGTADIQDAMYAEYKLENSKLLPVNQVKPHNQFLYTLVSLGIVGGIALCFIVFMPFFSRDAFKNYLLLMFLMVCLAAFQVEYMLERQVGITFFCLFYIILSPLMSAADRGLENKTGETNEKFISENLQ